MIPRYKIPLEKITLKDCPFPIYYEGNKLSDKFTFEELSHWYNNVKKYHLYLGERYKVNLYQLVGMKSDKGFSLYPIHHQTIWDDTHYLYVFSVPLGLELKYCIIPGTTWYSLNEDNILFQVVPSVLDIPNITEVQD